MKPCILRAPVDMTVYRRPKQRFRVENWMVVWFVEIGQWRRFCDRPDITLCDDTGYTSDAYMDWYQEVSRRCVGKPKPEPESDYASREFFDNYEAFQLVSVQLYKIFASPLLIMRVCLRVLSLTFGNLHLSLSTNIVAS